MIDRQLIEKKLRRIEEFLRELELAEVSSLEQFRKGVVTRRFVERNIELAIEQMIDICRHLVSGLDLNEPESYTDCLDAISKAGVLSGKHIDIFKSMVRFRNMLIHIYDGIDDSITFGIYKEHLNDFNLFVREIRDYLKRT